MLLAIFVNVKIIPDATPSEVTSMSMTAIDGYKGEQEHERINLLVETNAAAATVLDEEESSEELELEFESQLTADLTVTTDIGGVGVGDEGNNKEETASRSVASRSSIAIAALSQLSISLCRWSPFADDSLFCWSNALQRLAILIIRV